MKFLTETKCKIRFIYVGFNCKRKKVGQKNVWKLCPLRGGRGGVRRLMEKNILNFHFDYWIISLRSKLGLDSVNTLASTANTVFLQRPIKCHPFTFYRRISLETFPPHNLQTEYNTNDMNRTEMVLEISHREKWHFNLNVYSHYIVMSFRLFLR